MSMRFHAVSSMTAKCMDRSCSCQNFSTVRHSAPNEVFVSSIQRNPIAIDDQGIAALHNEHVFVVVVHMLRGSCVVGARPERHLDPITSVKHVSLDSWSGLVGLS